MEVGANVRDVKRTIEAHLRISHSILDSRADYGSSDLIRVGAKNHTLHRMCIYGFSNKVDTDDV